MDSDDLQTMLDELENARDEAELARRWGKFEGEVAEKVTAFGAKADYAKKIVRAAKDSETHFNNAVSRGLRPDPYSRNILNALATEAKDEVLITEKEADRACELYDKGFAICRRKFKEFRTRNREIQEMQQNYSNMEHMGRESDERMNRAMRILKDAGRI